MDHRAIDATLRRQEGVISRSQVLALGGDDLLIARQVRRRRWVRMLPGVYVDHTGAPSWRQRAWAAVLAHAPSGLAGRSALIAYGLADEDDSPIQTVVPRGRRVDDPPGIRSRQLTDFNDVVRTDLAPPRVRLEHAVLHTASAARTDDGAVAVLANAVQRRRTTAERLRDALRGLPRLRRRRFLAEVLDDVGIGALSALEVRYVRDVERPHGLPGGERQVREVAGSRRVERDVEYDRYRLLVELDGRLGHDDAEDRWNDLDRDIAAATTERMTVRVGWRQVLSACRLAAALDIILRARGWSGRAHPCGPACPIGSNDTGGSSAPGADDPPLSDDPAA